VFVESRRSLVQNERSSAASSTEIRDAPSALLIKDWSMGLRKEGLSIRTEAVPAISRDF
jgi:hypothetical protein